MSEAWALTVEMIMLEVSEDESLAHLEVALEAWDRCRVATPA